MKPSNTPKIMQLSNRELEVTQLILKEHTTREISKILVMGVASVETHRRRIRNKLEVRNVAGIVRKAMQANLIY